MVKVVVLVSDRATVGYKNNDRNYHVDNRNQNDLSIWLDLADPVDF